MTTLRPLLLCALWLGLNGITVFLLQLCLGIFNPLPTLLLSAAGLIYLIKINHLFCHYRKPESGIQKQQSLVPTTKTPASRQAGSGVTWDAVGLLAIITFFQTIHSMHYPLGGWDAWSCWNLKAKFIYLGHEHFRDMFEPQLWRSNTQYPLLLPCINVWFWSLVGSSPDWGPMILSITLTILCASILCFSVIEITKQKAPALIMTAAIFLLPFNTTLSAGQYSDVLVGLYLLCVFICYVNDDLKVMGAFLGLLSFTKTEGTVAAGILTVLLFCQYHRRWKEFLPTLIGFMLPTVLFTLFMAPHNEAFVNGLVSTTKPATWQRLKTALTYPLVELMSFKWNGIWFAVIAAVIWRWRKLTQPPLKIFGIFFAAFLTILFVYYQINTFFEITWWLNTTLHRILFMLMPSLFLWIAMSL